LLFPSPYHGVLAVKGIAPLALAACGRLQPLTACAAPCWRRFRAIPPVQPEIAMNALIADEQRFLLLANGRESLQNPDFDPAPVVKLFTPDAGATWLLTEVDPDDDDHAFGLCDLGLGMPELGWVSLQELSTVRGRLGLPIERDLHFCAEKRLTAYAREARLAGRIIV
jgi:hypothetical protein